MQFFKFKNKNNVVNTGDLALKDYDSIWTKFCFLDETGSLNDKNDPFFTVGILKMSQPYYLQSKILHERSVRGFHDEMKFNKLSKRNVDFAKFIINSIFDTRSIDFYSYTTRKDSNYFNKNFNDDQWIAYEKITLKLLDAALSENEIFILVADYVTTPKKIKFEVNTKKEFNYSKKRLALAGTCRFDSRSNDLLQVVDLLIGCISYELKLTEGIVSGSKQKLKIVDYFKKNLGAKSFTGGFRNRNFNIFVEKKTTDNNAGSGRNGDDE